MTRSRRAELCASVTLALCTPGLAAAPPTAVPVEGACALDSVPGAVWWGTERQLPLGRLAAYLAPALWFSPDEPLLEGAEGRGIRIPEPLPFDRSSGGPVLYYQFEEILALPDEIGSVYLPPNEPGGEGRVDLSGVGALKLSFFAYFHAEEGLGAHLHDVEAVEVKAAVARPGDERLEDYETAGCAEATNVVVLTRVTAKAHGLKWYWNVLEVDAQTVLPIHLLVEEGKHALATDKNADGYFTPGYDVSRYINDAWGVRDVIRHGNLFSGGYQSWMTKVRRPEHRVFPPLPPDSPLRARMERRAAHELGFVEYELRPFPPSERAVGDRDLRKMLRDKEIRDWPRVSEASELQEFADWIEEGNAIKSLAISLRADGDIGFSFVFPFLIVKNLEAPLAGGFVVWRMYLKDIELRDYGWMVMYMPSASRWIDTYLAAGAEWDREVVSGGNRTDLDFVLEAGLKFRVNISHSPLRFLTFFTDFWGLRAGVKNRGFFEINRLSYVLEVGAGAW